MGHCVSRPQVRCAGNLTVAICILEPMNRVQSDFSFSLKTEKRNKPTSVMHFFKNKLKQGDYTEALAELDKGTYNG